jgi:hypothetical protein
MSSRLIASWKTKGKDYINLYFNEDNGLKYYHYEGNGCGGALPKLENDDKAIEWMEEPWGKGAGPVTVLKSDRPSLKRVK